MKRNFLLFTMMFLCIYGYTQNKLTISSKTDTADISIEDSTFYIKIDGKEYVRIPKNKTLFLMDDAGAWDDLRVPVTATTVSGSNPPEFSSYKNTGGKYLGNALYFDGVDDYDSIPANKILNFSHNSFSIAFWMQYDSDVQNDAKILYKKNGWNIAFIHDKIRVYLEGKQVFFSTVDLNDGARNFVVVSIENNNFYCTVNIYINGKAAGTQTFYSTFSDVTAPVYIGKAESKGFGKNYKGILDEIYIWNKVLSSDERDSLWNKSKGTNFIIAKPNCVLGYSFDDKNKDFLVDNSTNKLNAYSIGITTTPSYVTGLISETLISHGVFAYFFEKDFNEELFFTAQLPHAWIEGSDIEAHVHYLRSSGDTGTVVWGLEYTWANILDEFPETKLVYSYDDRVASPDKQLYSSFGFLKGEGKKISSMLVCRIFRDAENPQDTFNDDVALLEIDFHVHINSFGSSKLLKK